MRKKFVKRPVWCSLVHHALKIWCPKDSYYEATFHLSDKVLTYNCRTQSLNNVTASVGLELDSCKENVFCALSEQKVYRPFTLLRQPTLVLLIWTG